jgi:hypothetical protein
MDANSGKLYRVDQLSFVSYSVPGGSNPRGITFDGGNIWTANNGDGTSGGSISRLNILTQVLTTFTTGFDFMSKLFRNVTCFNSLGMSHSFFSSYSTKTSSRSCGNCGKLDAAFCVEFSKRLWESGKTCSSFFHFSICAAVSIAFPLTNRKCCKISSWLLAFCEFRLLAWPCKDVAKGDPEPASVCVEACL